MCTTTQEINDYNEHLKTCGKPVRSQVNQAVIDLTVDSGQHPVVNFQGSSNVPQSNAGGNLQGSSKVPQPNPVGNFQGPSNVPQHNPVGNFQVSSNVAQSKPKNPRPINLALINEVKRFHEFLELCGNSVTNGDWYEKYNYFFFLMYCPD